jgi:hypothetical protein
LTNDRRAIGYPAIIDSDLQRHAEIAKLVKLRHSPLHKCSLIKQYKVLEADRQDFLECILISKRAMAVEYRLSGFAGSWRSSLASRWWRMRMTGPSVNERSK